MNGKSLELALTELARSFTSETGIPIALDIDAHAHLDGPAEREVYRIAAEALINVRWHARAAHVALDLRAANGATMLSIRDDGVGFAMRPNGDRFGLVGMEERAQIVGGRLRIESTPGAGTLVELALPGR